jgi:hypothetical protein
MGMSEDYPGLHHQLFFYRFCYYYFPIISYVLSLCFIENQATKAYGGKELETPRILNHGTKYIWVISFTLPSFTPLPIELWVYAVA